MGCCHSADQERTLGEYIASGSNCVSNYSQCHYIIRLRHILKLYNEWQSSIKQNSNESKEDNDNILNYINNAMITDSNKVNTSEPYSIVSILEHYHHLIDHHSIDFEEVYTYFSDDTDECSMASCNMIARNHRDRGGDNIRRRRRESYHKPSDSHQVILQQILDQIHCYIFHTFDMGFALTKQEKINILNEEQEEEQNDDVKLAECRGKHQERIGRVIQNKKKQIRELRNRIGHGLSLDENNKFMSNIDIMKDVDPKHIKQDSMFSFGVRYYYDVDKYKDNDDLDVEYNKGCTYSHWFVDKKYNHLQTELLKNETQCISKSQFNDLLHKSKEYLETEHVRLNCKNMRTKHLMCIMLYCNFDKLQSEFSKTYRHGVDEDDELLKLRHSEFAHFAETLQKAVESNGTMVDYGAIRNFYHGIDRELMFTSTLHKFCGPISTSSEYEVAMVFTQNNGIILELKDGTLFSDERNSIYFDCEWISDFGYEKEKLFVSTDVPLKIMSIFHVGLNANYGTYIKLITILGQIIEGDISLGIKEELTDRNIEAIVRLLKHELGEAIMENIPQYISKLLHHICLNIDSFTTRYDQTFAMNNHEYIKYKCLAEFLCCNECELFKLGLLCKLFPNLTSIAMECSLLTDKVFDNILLFLRANADNDKTQLNNFVFQSPVHSSVSLAKKYKQLFKEIDWTIEIEKQAKRFVIKRNEKVSAPHARDASTNVINSNRVFTNTEVFVVCSSLDVYSDDSD